MCVWFHIKKMILSPELILDNFSHDWFTSEKNSQLIHSVIQDILGELLTLVHDRISCALSLVLIFMQKVAHAMQG